ncbi:auxin-responsive protein IAA20 isoform X2 [Sorghum bicolor]|uniref:auxin-responsive protein IAA20 isoform X2 n=1 Tax=Sorghum bicolor TaxID=4558 RepID=UPI000B424A6A|nr:auxin-responsive protein IAA20 isoform X2 [Sorghum bicolor]|eukprot:XP_021304775.1 auxin-responsive protein IAA20 isoform X2 [Sorghum bicolor]
MELELGLALPNPYQSPMAAGGELVGLLSGSAGACGKKRVFGDAFGAAAKATLLPLFVHEDGDGGSGDHDDVDHDPSNKKKRLVGWPPVKCARRRSCGGGGGYVKVKMEGVAIGRKVDVSLHGSYQELLRTLERMFPSANQQGAGADAGHAEEEEVVASHAERRRRHPYVVTYEDGEGDWLLVGDDVPWEVFVKSVKRLKILA